MALVSKILEATLTAGSSIVTFTDADIPNSLIRVFSSDSNIIPESRTLSGNTLTVIYPVQTSNIDVALEIVKQGLDIVDNVLSEDTDKALSAKQGYLLSAAIGDVSDNLSTLTETVNNLDIPDNITDLDDVTVSSIQPGQVLAWDGAKFVNVDQSGGGTINYSTDEQNTGQKWIDGNDIYQISYVTTSSVTLNNSSWVAVFNKSGISKMINAETVRYTAGGDYISVACNAFNNNGAISFQVFNTSLSFNPGSVFTIKYTKS